MNGPRAFPAQARAALGHTLGNESSMQEILPAETSRKSSALTMIDAAGPAAQFAYEEFFDGQIRNPRTRAAYRQAVHQFLQWTAQQNKDLTQITPGMVGKYCDARSELAIPTKKLHLSALRRFFDQLVQRHVLILNPALTARLERYSVVEGRTPEITTAQARQLLASIELRAVADYRDRAVIATLIYTAARAGAIARLRLRDWRREGGQSVLRFHEKGGKQRVIPIRTDLERCLGDYVETFDPQRSVGDLPLFRTVKHALLTEHPMSNVDVCRMVKRRLAQAGLPDNISPHSFRACAATDLLLQGVPLEDVQQLLGHSDARVTRLYDRRQRQVTRNIVERISV